MEAKLWKEMLFLFIPFVIFIAVSLMAACGRTPSTGEVNAKNLAHSRGDPYSDLELNEEERKILRNERSL